MLSAALIAEEDMLNGGDPECDQDSSRPDSTSTGSTCRCTCRRRGSSAAAPESQDDNSSGVVRESQMSRGRSSGWLRGPAMPDLQVVADVDALVREPLDEAWGGFSGPARITEVYRCAAGQLLDGLSVVADLASEEIPIEGPAMARRV